MADEDKEISESKATEIAELENMDIETLRQALLTEKEETEKNKANWHRAEADLINYKKRAEQDRNDLSKFANSTLILNLLPILDDLERAFSSLSPKLKHLTWVDGIRLIHRKFQAILETQGLSEIKAVGKPFDPSLHEAVANMDGKEGMVINEVQKGYKLHDKVLRPSMVVVGKAKEEKYEEETPKRSD